MKTLKAVVVVLISSTIAAIVVSLSETTRAQQQAPAGADPRAFADRATEGAGATIFGNVCRSVSR